MKKLFISQLKDTEIYRKNTVLFIDQGTSTRYRNFKSSGHSVDSMQQTNANDNNNNYKTSNFNYPISDSIYYKTNSNFSLSPILTQRSTKSKYFNRKNNTPSKKEKSPPKTERKNHKKSLETQTLQFNKKLRLFMNIDEDKTKNKKFMEMVNKNIEEMYFDYDTSNIKKKTILFSGNNAGILRNKIYFVKGVMDYMFPKLTIKKMHFLNKEKNKRFKEEMKRANSLNQNDIYKKRIMSAKQIIFNSKYKYNGIFSTNNLRRQLLNKYKKIIVGGKEQFKHVHNYDFY
jgi:hypothetical protein